MTIEDELKDIITEKLAVKKEDILRESNLIVDLGADSLDLLEITMSLEDKYKMTIPDEEADKLKTVGQVLDYISSHYKPD